VQVLPQSKKWLPGPAVQRRYNKSRMTISRWVRDPKLDFPKPMVVNGRLFFAEDELEIWERRRAASAA